MTTESAEDLNEAESDESKRGHKRKLTGEPESPSVAAAAAANNDGIIFKLDTHTNYIL